MAKAKNPAAAPIAAAEVTNQPIAAVAKVAPVAVVAAVAAPVAEAPKPVEPPKPGKIQVIIGCFKAGMTNAQIIKQGFNKSTVNIQVAAYKKDPTGYDTKHATGEPTAETIQAINAVVLKHNAEVTAAPAPAAAPAAAPAPELKTDLVEEAELAEEEAGLAEEDDLLM